MNAENLKQLISRKPFRPFELVTAGGEHYTINDESQFLFNDRRPDLFVFFDANGVFRMIDVEQLTSAAAL